MYTRLASSQLDQAGHLFRICLGAVSAEAMVGKRTMGRSLAHAVAWQGGSVMCAKPTN